MHEAGGYGERLLMAYAHKKEFKLKETTISKNHNRPKTGGRQSSLLFTSMNDES